MARRNESGLFDLLMELPWWVSVGFSAVVFIGMRFVLPSIRSDDVIQNMMLTGLSQFGERMSWMAGLLLLPGLLSAIRSKGKRERLDRQTGIESIRGLSWKEFEELLGEAYRRQGYSVQENVGTGPDGGIDLTIKRNGSVYLIQCKQWRSFKVGVKVVREMLGLVTAVSAKGAIIVSSGQFTQAARAFALGKPLQLVEGDELVRMIASVQRPAGSVPASAAAMPKPAIAPGIGTGMGPRAPLPQTEAPRTPVAVGTSVRPKGCPKCGGEMVMRTARQGPNAGGKFWGCSGYPKCRHVEAYEGCV